MPYSPTSWVNDVTKLNATHMNNIESGIVNAVDGTLLDAKGDIIAASAADTPAKVTIGANDTVFVADSAQAAGVKWIQVGNAQVAAGAAISYSKLNLSASIVSGDIVDGTIVNADVNAAAAIAYSKLALGSSIVSADIVDGTIVNADINGSAAIAYSKLALANSIVTGDIVAGTIVDSDISASAAIQQSKLANGPGFELDYVAVTSNTNVTATTAATAGNIITGTTIAYDGTDVFVEMFCPQVTRGTNWLKYVLYDGSTQIGDVCAIGFSVQVGYGKVRVTPSVANHTYNFRAYVDAGTGVINAGTGAAGSLYPAFIRVTKA